MHVGNLPYGGNSSKVYNILAYESGEFMKETLTAAMPALLENYRVVVYNGQYDPLLGPALGQAWMDAWDWPGAAEFRHTTKKMWRVEAGDKEVARYCRTVGNLTALIVRGAGHMVPLDQPRRGMDILDRLVDG